MNRLGTQEYRIATVKKLQASLVMPCSPFLKAAVAGNTLTPSSGTADS